MSLNPLIPTLQGSHKRQNLPQTNPKSLIPNPEIATPEISKNLSPTILDYSTPEHTMFYDNYNIHCIRSMLEPPINEEGASTSKRRRGHRSCKLQDLALGI